MKTIIPLGLVLSLCCVGCQNKDKSPQQDITLVPVTYPLLQKKTPLDQTYFGRVVSRKKSTLSFQIGGTIKTRCVHIGQNVKKGTVLFKMDDHDYAINDQAAQYLYRAAQAHFRSAQKDYKNSLSLYHNHFIAEPDLKRRHAQLLSAQGEWYKARAHSLIAHNQQSETMLTAPYDGTLVSLFVEAGQNVGPGTPVAVLSENDKVDMLIDVAQNDISLFTLNQRAHITIDYALNQSVACQGTISQIGTDVNPLSGTYPLVLHLSQCSRPPHLGMTGSVSFQKEQSEQNNNSTYFLVPSSSVSSDAKGAFVFVSNQGILHKKRVVLADHDKNNADLYLVQGKDLSSKQHLVFGPVFMLHENQRIKETFVMNNKTLDHSETIGTLAW